MHSFSTASDTSVLPFAMIFRGHPTKHFRRTAIEIFVDCFRDESDFDSAVVCILILRYVYCATGIGKFSGGHYLAACNPNKMEENGRKKKKPKRYNTAITNITLLMDYLYNINVKQMDFNLVLLHLRCRGTFAVINNNSRETSFFSITNRENGKQI